MMGTSDVHCLELTEVARRLHAKEISPVELTESILRRIETLDRKLHAYALVTADRALAQAKEAEAEILKGHLRGPLHGVPIAVKDLCCTKDLPTSAGMPIHQNFKPEYDATVVERLREAGSVLLGKLQMTEGAYANHHPAITPPVNPWHPDHWSGASSSGSGVATAAGLCYASLGSDTGGSIRFPSAANGVTGIKPTWGRVSRYGIFELAASLDHIGPMCRSAADAGAVLGIIAGADPNDPTAVQDRVPNYLAGLERGLRGVRIGVDPRYNTEGVDTAMVKTVKDAQAVFEALGAEIRPVEFPATDPALQVWGTICAVETAVAHQPTYPSRKDGYGPGLAGLIESGRAVTGMDYQKALLVRHLFRGQVAALFQSIDLLLIPAQYLASPTVRQMATLGNDPTALQSLLRFTAPFDMTGSPTITLPSGFTAQGTPIAFQLVSRHLEEDLLVRAGYAYQRETDWHRAHPEL